jgi:hypothetical protein
MSAASMALAASMIAWMSPPAIRPSVSSIAVSIIESAKALMP